MEILKKAVLFGQSQQESFVLATIVRVQGSTSRREGTKCIVHANGTIVGTIGGGPLEEEIRRVALEVLQTEKAILYTFGADTDREAWAQCGGKVDVFLEPFLVDATVWIIGAGHVGQAVARAAQLAEMSVTVIDERLEMLQQLDGFATVVHREFGKALGVGGLFEEGMVVIATPSHDTDFLVLRQALQRKVGYIGLLGSKKKKALFFDRLREEGFKEEQLERIRTPIGLDIGAKTPGEIGIAVVAELLHYKKNKKNDRLL